MLAAGAAVTELADPITTIFEKQLGLFQEITLELPVSELLLTEVGSIGSEHPLNAIPGLVIEGVHPFAE